MAYGRSRKEDVYRVACHIRDSGRVPNNIEIAERLRMSQPGVYHCCKKLRTEGRCFWVKERPVKVRSPFDEHVAGTPIRPRKPDRRKKARVPRPSDIMWRTRRVLIERIWRDMQAIKIRETAGA